MRKFKKIEVRNKFEFPLKDTSTTLAICDKEDDSKVVADLAAYEFRGFSIKETNENVKRIINCWNACVDMKNPAKEISAMKKKIKILEKELAEIKGVE